MKVEKFQWDGTRTFNGPIYTFPITRRILRHIKKNSPKLSFGVSVFIAGSRIDLGGAKKWRSEGSAGSATSGSSERGSIEGPCLYFDSQEDLDLYLASPDYMHTVSSETVSMLREGRSSDVTLSLRSEDRSLQ